jgi:hypothetical protein
MTSLPGAFVCNHKLFLKTINGGCAYIFVLVLRQAMCITAALALVSNYLHPYLLGSASAVWGVVLCCVV